MMKNLILVAFLVLGNIAFSQSADDIVGLWFNEPKDAKIKVFKQNGKYYGKIVWLKDSIADNGGPRLDIHNDDEELQKRHLIGLQIINDLEWDADDKEWQDGDIYDARSGSTYSSYAVLEQTNKLKLRGYIGFSIIGRTTYWTRIK